jgi:hypothetical protein
VEEDQDQEEEKEAVACAIDAPPSSNINTTGKQARCSDSGKSKKHLISNSREALACARLAPSMPLSGLDLLTAEVGVNLLDLSALTAVHFGDMASSHLTKNPSRLRELVSRRKPSYLNYVPARYGHSQCLDDAVRCVALKARRVLSGSRLCNNLTELSLYGKALRSLQDAVDDLGDPWQSPDVLCTIQVLSLYEVSRLLFC